MSTKRRASARAKVTPAAASPPSKVTPANANKMAALRATREKLGEEVASLEKHIAEKAGSSPEKAESSPEKAVASRSTARGRATVAKAPTDSPAASATAGRRSSRKRSAPVRDGEFVPTPRAKRTRGKSGQSTPVSSNDVIASSPEQPQSALRPVDEEASVASPSQSVVSAATTCDELQGEDDQPAALDRLGPADPVATATADEPMEMAEAPVGKEATENVPVSNPDDELQSTEGESTQVLAEAKAEETPSLPENGSEDGESAAGEVPKDCTEQTADAMDEKHVNVSQFLENGMPTKRLFRNARYFIIKSNNHENVDIAKARNVWATLPYNEKKLNKAFKECNNVILIFSVRESGQFQGWARLASEAVRDGTIIPWVLPRSMQPERLDGLFRLQWIHKGRLDFQRSGHLKNPWNENQAVKIGRDGQEVEPTVGENLCRLFFLDGEVKIRRMPAVSAEEEKMEEESRVEEEEGGAEGDGGDAGMQELSPSPVTKSAADTGDDVPSDSAAAATSQQGEGESVSVDAIACEPSPTNAEAEPSPTNAGAEPSPTNAEAEPGPTNAEAEPSPTNAEAEPSPTNAEAEPSPTNAEAEPSPTNAEAEPSPTNAEAEPSPTNAEPEPSPTNAEAEPEVEPTESPVDAAESPAMQSPAPADQDDADEVDGDELTDAVADLVADGDDADVTRDDGGEPSMDATQENEAGSEAAAPKDQDSPVGEESAVGSPDLGEFEVLEEVGGESKPVAASVSSIRPSILYDGDVTVQLDYGCDDDDDDDAAENEAVEDADAVVLDTGDDYEPIHSEDGGKDKDDEDGGEEVEKKKKKESDSQQVKEMPAEPMSRKSSSDSRDSEGKLSPSLSGKRSRKEISAPSKSLSVTTSNVSQFLENGMPTKRLFRKARYFIIKSNNHENVDIAKARNVWATLPYNEKKLNKAFKECNNVILIFSVRESGQFQGWARLASEAVRDGTIIPWVLPRSMQPESLDGLFRLQWIHKGRLDFQRSGGLKNPWNENKAVKIGRDGQEVEPTVGENLCRLFFVDGEGSPSGRTISIGHRSSSNAASSSSAKSSGSSSQLLIQHKAFQPILVSTNSTPKPLLGVGSGSGSGHAAMPSSSSSHRVSAASSSSNAHSSSSSSRAAASGSSGGSRAVAAAAVSSSPKTTSSAATSGAGGGGAGSTEQRRHDNTPGNGGSSSGGRQRASSPAHASPHRQDDGERRQGSPSHRQLNPALAARLGSPRRNPDRDRGQRDQRDRDSRDPRYQNRRGWDRGLLHSRGDRGHDRELDRGREPEREHRRDHETGRPRAEFGRHGDRSVDGGGRRGERHGEPPRSSRRRSRSRSRSPLHGRGRRISSDGREYGVNKATILHGSYDEYVREYQRRQTSGPSPAAALSAAAFMQAGHHSHSGHGYSGGGPSKTTYDAACTDFLLRTSMGIGASSSSHRSGPSNNSSSRHSRH